MKPQKLLDSSYFEGPKQLDSKKQAKLKGWRKFFSQASLILTVTNSLYFMCQIACKCEKGHWNVHGQMLLARKEARGGSSPWLCKNDAETLLWIIDNGESLVSRQYLCGLLWFYFRCIRCCCRRRRSCGRLPSLGAANSEIERISFTKCWLDTMTHICPFTSSLQLTFLVNKLIKLTCVFCCFQFLIVQNCPNVISYNSCLFRWWFLRMALTVKPEASWQRLPKLRMVWGIRHSQFFQKMTKNL